MIFIRFYFSVYSLVFVSIEKIYRALETVFHRLSKLLEFRPKYYAVRCIFNSLSVFGYPDETLSIVFDIFRLGLVVVRAEIFKTEQEPITGNLHNN